MLMEPAVAIPRARKLLVPQAFGSGAHRTIAQAMYELHAEGITLDPLTLSARLAKKGVLEDVGGKNYIGFLVDAVPTAANIEYHARMVRAEYDKRQAHAYLTNALRALEKGEVTARDIAVEVQAAMLPLAVEGDDTGFRWITPQDIDDVLREIDRRAERVKAGNIPGIPSGYAEIDRVTNGFRLGEFVVFGGAPKSLKSYLCINILINTAMRRGFGGLVSAEMTFASIMERMVTAASLVSVSNVGRGFITGSERERMLREGNRLATFLAIDDAALPELGDVIARATDLKAQQPRLEILVVDYIQLVQNKMQGRNYDTELNGITKALRGLAKRLDVVLIAPAQCNYKEVEARADKMPQLRDYQGASGMAQDPDLAGNILNRRQYDPSAAPVLEIEFQGVRRTPRFTAFIEYDPQSMAMIDRPKPQLRVAP